ncbi:MAG TPA: hypothetical protein VF526_21460 [Solirubrobacteraceae bacterium]
MTRGTVCNDAGLTVGIGHDLRDLAVAVREHVEEFVVGKAS